MYATGARKALHTVLSEAPEMEAALEGWEKRERTRLMRQLTDRLILELWMRGFAVSARKVGDRPPTEKLDHDAWRSSKRATAEA